MFKRLSVVLLLALLSILIIPVFAIGEDTTSIPGYIALVGADFNVYTYNFAASELTPLSLDADRTRHYQWPTWSNDGRIAYFCCDLRVTSELNSEVFIAADATTAGEIAYEDEGSTVIYAYWSPANCADGVNCRDLALLMNDVMDGGLSVEMLRNQADTTTNRTIGTGSPFYYHWNAAGTQMVFHRNSRRIDVYDIAQSDVSTEFEEPSSGLFQAPAWSPVDSRILFATSAETRGQSNIVVAEGDTITTLVSNLRGFVSFLWSPDGNYIAYRTFNSDEIGAVVVIDSRTGAEVTRSSLNSAVSFFWSPDSTKVAYLTFSQRTGGGYSTRWSVLDIELNSNVQYSSFIPSYEMGYLIQYFDQFAPSHRLWSPDSRYLVYSEVIEVDGGFTPQVSVIDVSQPASNPIKVADGVFGVWSFE
jgi:TolB protein